MEEVEVFVRKEEGVDIVDIGFRCNGRGISDFGISMNEAKKLMNELNKIIDK